jgi:hypothetical protein
MWAITTAIRTQHALSYPGPLGVESESHWPNSADREGLSLFKLNYTSNSGTAERMFISV